MERRITSYEEVKNLKEIILKDSNVCRELYKVIEIDRLSIRLKRKGPFSRLRILPMQDIMKGEWYFESEKGLADHFPSNPDSQLLKEKRNANNGL